MPSDLTGAAAQAERLTQLAITLPREVGRAQRQRTEQVRTICVERCPWEFSVLRGTIHAEGPEFIGGAIITRIVAGGPAAPYALIVHEDILARHPKPGTSAKYIEGPLMEAVPSLAADIGALFDLNRAAAT